MRKAALVRAGGLNSVAVASGLGGNARTHTGAYATPDAFGNAVACDQTASQAEALSS